MTAVRVMLTYADYVELRDDGKRYEIHDGELSVTAAPTFWPHCGSPRATSAERYPAAAANVNVEH